MPIQQILAKLSGRFYITVESSPEIVRKVQRRMHSRYQKAINAGNAPPQTKQPSVVPALAGKRRWDIRPIDFLRKLGRVTTPPATNMAKLSSSWATLRYFWAVQESDPQHQPSPFRLSQDARGLDFHQKTLLSDEFGIGLGTLLMEHLLQADKCVDISRALA